MVEVASIVIAVISFVGVVVAALVTGWLTLYSEKRRRKKEAERLISKYKDPLVFAASELQSRFYNLTELGILSVYGSRGQLEDLLIAYTCYLVGQYLSWTYILLRRVQFLQFSTNQNTTTLADKIEQITNKFSTSDLGEPGVAFILWRGSQRAIGEIMTKKEDDGEYMCIGYSEFFQRWKIDEEFRDWFASIEFGIVSMAKARRREDRDLRVRHLQHLLVDLLHILEPDRWKSEKLPPGRYPLSRCEVAIGCKCDGCKSKRTQGGAQAEKRRHLSQISGIRKWGSQMSQAKAIVSQV